MSQYDHHHDWLSLIEISGPFLAVPVLKDAFPQGLEELDGIKRKRLRQAYEEWREALELEDAQFAELHAAWIDEVLSRGLELDEDGKGDVLKRADWCAANLRASLPEHGATLSPDLAVIDEQRANQPLLLIQTYAQDVDLDATLKQYGWAATPADRMVALCRALGCRLGLVTNGERWMLVDAPVGAVTTFASWYARIWSQEPITLQAFVHLLGIRRFFVDESEQLPALFDRSLKFQDEVTDALGEQVRRAVEVLIQTLDKADQDRNRELLHDVKEPELYEAALTVMMRLVFLLSAEERGLLLMGDERYEANYALSTLRMQLRKESEEILERRWDAWSRLLAIFRVVFGGIEHENLRLPALGGSLFDPDRFPCLEGRAKGSNWCTDAATPLPIDNRTVLLLLEAIQQFQGRTLSYRALDVEQIGYVYEGLLERTVKRTDEVTLELDATKNAKTPWIKLAELDSARLDGGARLAELLQERSGSSASRVRNDLAKSVDDTFVDRLLTACQGDTKLRDRVKPYAHLLRTDPWGYPLVYPVGAFIVTTGSDRRETGTHYTPKSLTEAIIAETLTPVAYVGPAEGMPRDQWVLKSPAKLLDLKICDPAMGSGAFLVQACRWLADRLVEAWSQVEATGKAVSVDGEVLEIGEAKEPLPRDSETRTVIARRLIAERCLYGVDLNPLAVELAKLSIWLVTLAKGRPFGFLDHNLRCGDSLLGIHRLDQLTELSIAPNGKGQKRLFGQNIERAVDEAIELRRRLRQMPIWDIRDVEAMARMDADARQKLEVPERIADAFVGDVLVSGGNAGAFDNAVASLAIQAGQAIASDGDALHSIVGRACRALSVDLPAGRSARRPFHWPLEFPEVFDRQEPGFDSMIGNPPFLGGRRMRAILGDCYLGYLTDALTVGGSANANLCAYFFLRATQLFKRYGTWGLIATSAISEGDSRRTGLNRIIDAGNKIYQAIPLLEWPGNAAVTIALVWTYGGDWAGRVQLGGLEVSSINASLAEDVSVSWEPADLIQNKGRAFQGSNILGKGFVLEPEEADALFSKDPRSGEIIRRFLRGEDFVDSPTQEAKKLIIDFGGMPLSKDAAPVNYSGPVAEDYRECLSRITEKVKPERSLQKRKPYRERWWQYAERCASLYSAISGLSRVIFQPSPSKHLAFCFVDGNQVFSGPHTVIAADDFCTLGVLVSSVHAEWCWAFCSTMPSGSRRYNPSDFLKFPFPENSGQIARVAEIFDTRRCEFMRERSIGVGAFMNMLHDESCSDSRVLDLRSALKELDGAIFESYGWSDLELEYQFRTVGKGKRLGLTPNLAKEVMNRLRALNIAYSKIESSVEMHRRRSPTISDHVAMPSLGSNKTADLFSDSNDLGGHR
ncbi:Eco57I restriction-modification methylase domain-containing protein [Robbsia andropogonis]|uniref:Eco57I restriction-modification methylase domain-containing protein n=1 Tax=Robbsia andropogonis TaxID=28092 RepID=UPI000464A7AA|nr:type IIL restriction-modification enzyme MmeI [Robbsia andropogonis]